MEFADSALLADMIFEWHETPFCTLTNGIDNLHVPQDHSNLMGGMLVDIDLPEIISIPEPPFSHLAIATYIAKPVSSPLWPSDGAPPPNVSDIPQTVAVSETLVKFPLVVKKGATFDVSLEEASFDGPKSPQSASALSTPPAVKRTRRSSKREPRSKAKVPAKSRKRVDAEQVKENRAPTHAEHIIRERQRRDDMAAKYLVLESLLPPASKRERAVVVEDATLLVRALQQKKVELLKRRAHLKLVQAAPNHHSPRSTKNVIRSSPKLHNIISPGTADCIKQQHGAVFTLEENNSSKSDSPLSSSDGAVGQEKILNTKSSTISSINVHTGEEDIEVEIVWNRPSPNFQSSLLQAVESLGSEVTRCSILRVATGFLQCVITCSKPEVPSQLKAEIQASETLIMGALRNVLTQSS